MAGFFDGILLHQVLQWHHLLSLVPDERLQDPRAQIAADGAFHILMYVLLLVGLAGLWRRRARIAALPVRAVGGSFLLGFGLWQVIDVVGFHWLLRLHHVRLDVPAPIAWDVAWLILLGFPPLIVSWFLLRKTSGSSPPTMVLPTVLAIATLAAALQAARPSPGGNAVVLFTPGVSSARVMEGLVAADARLVEINANGDVAVVSFEMPRKAWILYRYGALIVGGAGPAGCAASVS